MASLPGISQVNLSSLVIHLENVPGEFQGEWNSPWGTSIPLELIFSFLAELNNVYTILELCEVANLNVLVY